MKVYDAQTLRNVALVGHSGAGKTQLLSALLFDAGAVNRFGRVDDGTTVTDYDEEEIARKHTLSASLAYAEWNKTKINFIDTPGMANFLSDARAALRVADAALVVVDAVAGVAGVDREGVGRRRGAGDCRGSSCSTGSIASAPAWSARSSRCARVFGRTVIPIQLPIGEEKAFPRRRRSGGDEGVDVRDRRQRQGDRRRGARRPRGAAQAAREALIEMVAEADDALMEKFFESGTLTQEELLDGLRRGVAAGRDLPGALQRRRPPTSACQPLLDAIVDLRPVAGRAPVRRHRAKSGDEAVHVTAVGYRPDGAVRLEDGRRSVRRTHHAVPRDLRDAEGRLDRAQRHPRRPRAARTPARCCRARRRPTCRRSRPAISAPSRSSKTR